MFDPVVLLMHTCSFNAATLALHSLKSHTQALYIDIYTWLTHQAIVKVQVSSKQKCLETAHCSVHSLAGASPKTAHT